MTLESSILRDVHQRLGSRPDVRLWRFNAGKGWTKTSTGFAPMQFCPTGFPDLAGWVTVISYAIWLGVECKSESGRMRPEQTQWRKWADEFGGIYLLVRSADEAERLLLEAVSAISRDIDRRSDA